MIWNRYSEIHRPRVVFTCTNTKSDSLRTPTGRTNRHESGKNTWSHRLIRLIPPLTAADLHKINLNSNFSSLSFWSYMFRRFRRYRRWHATVAPRPRLRPSQASLLASFNCFGFCCSRAKPALQFSCFSWNTTKTGTSDGYGLSRVSTVNSVNTHAFLFLH